MLTGPPDRLSRRVDRSTRYWRPTGSTGVSTKFLMCPIRTPDTLGSQHRRVSVEQPGFQSLRPAVGCGAAPGAVDSHPFGVAKQVRGDGITEAARSPADHRLRACTGIPAPRSGSPLSPSCGDSSWSNSDCQIGQPCGCDVCSRLAVGESRLAAGDRLSTCEIASPATDFGVHRPQHGKQHAYDPADVVRGQVATNETDLLGALGD
jgi:hypothetical protein